MCITVEKTEGCRPTIPTRLGRQRPSEKACRGPAPVGSIRCRNHSSVARLHPVGDGDERAVSRLDRGEAGFLGGTDIRQFISRLWSVFFPKQDDAVRTWEDPLLRDALGDADVGLCRKARASRAQGRALGSAACATAATALRHMSYTIITGGNELILEALFDIPRVAEHVGTLRAVDSVTLSVMRSPMFQSLIWIGSNDGRMIGRRALAIRRDISETHLRIERELGRIEMLLSFLEKKHGGQALPKREEERIRKTFAHIGVSLVLEGQQIEDEVYPVAIRLLEEVRATWREDRDMLGQDAVCKAT